MTRLDSHSIKYASESVVPKTKPKRPVKTSTSPTPYSGAKISVVFGGDANLEQRAQAADQHLVAIQSQSLLAGTEAFQPSNLCLHEIDGAAGLSIKCDGLAVPRLDEDLHAWHAVSETDWGFHQC